jgi:hypothetical protein
MNIQKFVPRCSTKCPPPLENCAFNKRSERERRRRRHITVFFRPLRFLPGTTRSLLCAGGDGSLAFSNDDDADKLSEPVVHRTESESGDAISIHWRNSSARETRMGRITARRLGCPRSADAALWCCLAPTHDARRFPLLYGQISRRIRKLVINTSQGDKHNVTW